MTIPQQRDLLTKRWRRVKAPRQREDKLQMEVVKYFNIMRVSSALCIHIPNQEMRKERFGKLKAMGACPGAADLLFIKLASWSFDPFPTVLFLEMKRLGEVPSDRQLAFGDSVKVCGAHYEYADNKQMAIDALEKYGFVRKDVSRAAARGSANDG